MSGSFRLSLLGAVALVMLLVTVPAQAGLSPIDIFGFSGGGPVVDFDTIGNEVLITNQYTGSGVVFSGALLGMTNSGDLGLFPANGGGVIASNWIYGGWGSQGLSFTADFSSLHGRAGFYLENWPSQTFTVEAFNGSTSLGSISFATSSVTAEFKGLESTDAFNRLVFTNTATDNGFYAIDDFRFEPGTAVPVPPSLLLLAPGLVGVAAMRRRFKR